jgi:hypothetical protein
LNKLLVKITNINYLDFSIISFFNIHTLHVFYIKKTSNLIRIPADKRIGPHNKDILSIISGSLLGDGHAERRIQGKGTRITFYQEGSHVSYLL